ncbi:GNAT family N-acetyltransferase [Pedobacter sp. KBW06]|uniref:GNAT family N-acetyltransferase n=1 Tax=Pedobacter sp. KBW06 TaxID=2153359 RepID=UPI000F5B1B8B|nr:GNAT family N-acetyltransferase [Pedobacter sp. KBW06]RQO70677.1 GNAT family N-acetyltransferase [Pedobacter sp. KBW06]
MTNRIYLKKFSAYTDFSDYYLLVSNEQVMAMVTERGLPMEEATAEFENVLKRNEKYPDFGRFKIFDSATDQFIGLGKMDLSDTVTGEAELGYLLLPEYWGKGYGTEIAQHLMALAESSPFLHKITAIIDPANAASRKILINQGFVSEQIAEIDGLPGEILGKKIKG